MGKSHASQYANFGSLQYLAKVLKVNIVEKPRPIPPKVTLIM